MSKKPLFFLILLCVLILTVSGFFFRDREDISEEKTHSVLFEYKRQEIGDLVLDIEGDSIEDFLENSLVDRPVRFVKMEEPGSENYVVNLMSFIESFDPESARAKLIKEMLLLYEESSSGGLDDAVYHVNSSALAGIHSSETGNKTFLDSVYGQNNGIYSEELMTLRNFNSVLHESLGMSGSGSVYKDANSDGFPDGPFQILNGSSDYKSNIDGYGVNSDRSFDVYYFPDNLAWVNYDISQIYDIYGMGTLEDREISMFSALRHTRGSFKNQAFGIPYTPNGSVSFNDFVDASNEDIMNQARIVTRDLLSSYLEYKPPIVGTDNPSQSSLAIMLLIKKGWYFSADMSLNLEKRLDGAQGISTFRCLFKEEVERDGLDMEQIKPSQFLKKYIISPWDNDVFRKFGLTEHDYRKIYGVLKNDYSSYYSWDFLYKVEEELSDFYKNGKAPVIHSWDFLSLGEATAAGLTGDYVLLKLMAEAGVPSEVNGVNIDLTNPDSFYKSLLRSNPNSFDPRGSADESELYRKFERVLDLLKVDIGYERRAVLWHAYKESGHYYVYGGGGRPTFGDYYNSAKRYYSKNIDYINSIIFRSRDGNSYVSGMTDDSDLEFKGVRLYDCSSLVSAGLSLGNFTSSSTPYRWYSSYGFVKKFKNPDDRGKHMVDFMGVSYDTGLRGVSSGAYTVKEYLSDESLVENGLQPGDILALNGHVLLFLGVAPEDMVLDRSITRRNVDVIVRKGDALSIEAWDTGQINGVKLLTHDGSFYVLRPYMFD